jgi:transcription elongation factor Elf1
MRTPVVIPANEIEAGDLNLHYKAIFHCLNCRAKNVFYLKKGVRVDSVSVTCGNCGCAVNGKPPMPRLDGEIA